MAEAMGKTAAGKAGAKPGAKAEKPEEKKYDWGRHNLVLLGIGATAIAILTTMASLYIYHASGDIYLDRSRPGFLPDDEEVEEQAQELEENWKFSENGAVDAKALEEYLQKLKSYQDDLKDLPDPFPIDSLRIPSAE